MENTKFAWIAFYMELATKLIPYSENRSDLVSKIKTVYEKAGINLPTLEKNGKVYDIDPFTTFGLFNKGITDANRIKIITAFANEFDVKANIPSSFDGIPVLNNQMATFYWFEDERGEHDIDNLWNVFTNAIEYAYSSNGINRDALGQAIDSALAQKGVKWNITMGLFWIRPYTFINLDSRNRWFISKPSFTSKEFVERLPKLDTVPAGKSYLALCEDCAKLISTGAYNYKTFPELSAYAWTAAQADNAKEKPIAEQEKLFRKWMSAQTFAAGAAMKQPSISNNVNALKRVCTEMTITEFPDIKNLFEVTDLDQFRQIRDCIMNHPDYDKVNHAHGNGYLNSALTIWYENFLKWLADGGDPDGLSTTSSSTNALADDESTIMRYWMYTVFDDASWEECQTKEIMVIGMDDIGDYAQYGSKEAIRQALIEKYEGDSSRKNQALMAWNFSQIMKVNDVVFAKRANTLVGKGIVTGEYVFDSTRQEYKSIRTVRWLAVGTWEHPGNAVAKRLTDITAYKDYVEQLNAICIAENPDPDEEDDTPEIDYPPYFADDFLDEVYMTEDEYNTLAAVLKNKKNIILQGAPGVGKTFAAKRLAYSIMGKKDSERVMMVQFHQGYSYEDFIMGFRPSGSGFELKKGAFYNFCKKAESDSDNDYFFIIDEINRGNLSKIFGELFMLIETDKRSNVKLQLLYADEMFSVPANLYIIGMMNTADRSLAMLDYALRRRFAFISLKPGFDTDGFRNYRMGLDSEKFNRLISCVESLNSVITSDDSLGEGFCIGHSYFCNLTPDTVNDQSLSAIVEFELIPLLKEYWFDEPTKVRDWSANLRSAIK